MKVRSSTSSTRHRISNFLVAISFQRVGIQQPSRREVTTAIRQWLSRLDPDELMGQTDLPSKRFRFRDWEVDVRAIPKIPAARQDPPAGLIGLGPNTVGYVNDADRLRRVLGRKASRYGNPGEPIIIATLLASNFGFEDAVQNALFGSMAVRIAPSDPSGQLVRRRDGFWMAGPEATNTRVSGVLVGVNILPEFVANTWPRLWLNPWAQPVLRGARR